MVSSATGQAINMAGKFFLNVSMMVCTVSGHLQIMCFVFVPCSHHALTLLFVFHILVKELNEVKHVDVNGDGCPNGQKKKCPGISPACKKCTPTDLEVPVASPYKDEDDNDAKDVEVPVEFKPSWACPDGQKKSVPD